ncbi:MAG: ribose 5-phosphate isomerase B [Deltaproteobacteria bacterium]|nr:ribose 5-phosphate isomerase B [Deltaproteobacteria bacterium]
MSSKSEERIAISCDHRGVELKESLLELFRDEFTFEDMGTFDENTSVDYPDYASRLAHQMAEGKLKRGILICGTGVGMSIVANKFPGIRAVLVADPYTARMAREHNDANVLVLGGRVLGVGLASEIVRIWLTTSFAGGRHQHRLEKLSAIEKKLYK